jgi:orotidine-5'-phosphate decarboxylase
LLISATLSSSKYHDGALRISEFADIVNVSVFAGPGIVEALAQTIQDNEFPYRDERASLILAEMTTKGSLATGEYTKESVEIAGKYRDVVIGFVAMRALGDVEMGSEAKYDEGFVVFTTGVNREVRGDKLGQRYQTPAEAVARGADIIIAGRGIYEAEDPVAAVKLYQKEGWEAYLKRIGN